MSMEHFDLNIVCYHSTQKNMEYLGPHAGYELYIKRADVELLYKFMLFTLAVSEPVPPPGAKPAEVPPVKPPPKPSRKPAERVVPPPTPAPPPTGMGGGPAANPRVPSVLSSY